MTQTTKFYTMDSVILDPNGHRDGSGYYGVRTLADQQKTMQEEVQELLDDSSLNIKDYAITDTFAYVKIYSKSGYYRYCDDKPRPLRPGLWFHKWVISFHHEEQRQTETYHYVVRRFVSYTHDIEITNDMSEDEINEKVLNDLPNAERTEYDNWDEWYHNK